MGAGHAGEGVLERSRHKAARRVISGLTHFSTLRRKLEYTLIFRAPTVNQIQV
jgi:hypothetical protein